ncbi:DUF2332 domain-containing protein [Salinibacillus aidingensis]|uniref:DUF2332 domain-containing protein n=1 Tax=Virgibacillus sp. MSP4-1 TaxID=2700081 RepID=UPI0005C782C5
MILDSSIATKFQEFAEQCHGSSALYERLSLKIADDEQILDLCTHAKPGQPIPNLLFATVQYLLFKGQKHPLRNFYASIVDSPEDDIAQSFTHFKDFCLKHDKEIKTILQNKNVQTNEVRRCAYLYPCFCYMYEKAKKPLALIEIGTSAGLQLLWDQYSYSYGTSQIYGNPQAEVHIDSKTRGDIPFLLSSSPPVVKRFGVDLHINRLSIDEDKLWLKALIWPEHEERRKIFEAASQVVNKSHLELIEGDGVDLLPEIVKKIPNDTIIGVFHTHVANQFSNESKEKLLHLISKIGEERDIFHLYNNIQDRYLHLDYVLNGENSHQIIGETEGHGRWFSLDI